MVNYLTILLGVAVSCTQYPSPLPSKDSEISQSHTSAVMRKDFEVDRNGLSKIRVFIKTTYGDIVYKFYPQKAPKTVARVIQLIDSGFYNGLSFHRVVPNFIIQGGDPTNSGTGGSGTKIPAEFNNLQHIRGTVAMARSSHPDSADSQFYISLSTFSHLNGKFTIFGQVIDEFNVLDKIKQGDKMITVSIDRK